MKLTAREFENVIENGLFLRLDKIAFVHNFLPNKNYAVDLEMFALILKAFKLEIDVCLSFTKAAFLSISY